MQTCPKCKHMIEDDGWFCDQCGVELMVCPNCKALKRGIRCNSCGTKLVTAKDFASGAGVLGSNTTPPSGNTTPPSGNSIPPSGNVNIPTGGAQTPNSPRATNIGQASSSPFSGNIPQQPVGADSTVRPGMQQQPSRASLPRPDHLVCQSPRLRLGVGNGAVIGRRGDYAQAFVGQGFVSGLHARLQFNMRGELELVDLGSTNGTFVNGVQLSPNVPKVICIGDAISFAGMEFKAEP